MKIKKCILLKLILLISVSSFGFCEAFNELNKDLRIVFSIEPQPDRVQILDWVQQAGWCWGIEVSPHIGDKDLIDLQKRGFNIVLDMHAHPEILNRHYSYHKRPIPDQDQILKRHIDLAGGKQENVIWQMLLENDSAGVAHPQDLIRARVKTHKEAKDLLDQHLTTAWSYANKYPDIHKWGTCGYASSAHQFAASGLECIMIERTNDDVDDLQTGIAFCRGAGRQYGCDWGVDFSLWWGVFCGCVQHVPTSYHRRNMYLSYFSGARTFRVEGGDLFWDYEKNKLHILADTLDEWSQFATKVDPGKPDIPVAIILPNDHGWITPPYWNTTNEIWNYARLAYRPGDRGIDGFFGNAFPGSNFAMQPFPFGKFEVNDPPASPFALSCVTPEFAPTPADIYYAQPPIPFGKYRDRKQAYSDIVSNQIETSPYRPMADSRWGDIFDVFTDEVGLDILKHYQAVIITGPVTLTDHLKKTLHQYVKDGGTLALAAGVASPDDTDLTGLTLSPELIPTKGWQWDLSGFTPEALLYLPAKVEKNTRVLAWTPSLDPLIAQKNIGSGMVFTCTVPWFEGNTKASADVAVKLFDHIIRPLQPAHIEGLPVEWITTTADNHKMIILANHFKTSWSGQVSINKIPADYTQCVDVITGKTVDFSVINGNAVVQTTINPYDIRILKWF